MTAGTLVLDKDNVIPPTGETIDMPPESCSLIFDGSDKIIKAVGGGIVMDRSIGNTRGLGGE